MFAPEFDFHSTVLIASSNKESEQERKLVGNGIQIDRKRTTFIAFFSSSPQFPKLALEIA